MKSKSSTGAILGALLLGSLALNVYLYSRASNVVEPIVTACPPDVAPSYGSVTFDEASTMHNQYLKDRTEGDPNATTSVWVGFDDLQNYICVVRENAEREGMPLEHLGMRVYFTSYANTEGIMQDNIAFVPGNKVGDEPNDWPAEVLQRNVPGTDKTFIMNRHMPCPSSCGIRSLK